MCGMPRASRAIVTGPVTSRPRCVPATSATPTRVATVTRRCTPRRPARRGRSPRGPSNAAPKPRASTHPGSCLPGGARFLSRLGRAALLRIRTRSPARRRSGRTRSRPSSMSPSRVRTSRTSRLSASVPIPRIASSLSLPCEYASSTLAGANVDRVVLPLRHVKVPQQRNAACSRPVVVNLRDAEEARCPCVSDRARIPPRSCRESYTARYPPSR